MNKRALLIFAACLWSASGLAQDARLKELEKFMAEPPKKSMVYDKRNAKRAQFIADHGVTLTRDFDVLGVDAGEGAPDLVWIFRERVIPAKCELVKYADATRASDAESFMKTLKPFLDDKTRAAVARNFVEHIACTLEQPLSRKAKMTITLPSPTAFVSLKSAQFQGEVSYVAHIDKTKLNVFALPVAQ